MTSAERDAIRAAVDRAARVRCSSQPRNHVQVDLCRCAICECEAPARPHNEALYMGQFRCRCTECKLARRRAQRVRRESRTSG